MPAGTPDIWIFRHAYDLLGRQLHQSPQYHLKICIVWNEYNELTWPQTLWIMCSFTYPRYRELHHFPLFLTPPQDRYTPFWMISEFRGLIAVLDPLPNMPCWKKSGTLTHPPKHTLLNEIQGLYRCLIKWGYLRRKECFQPRHISSQYYHRSGKVPGMHYQS